VNARAIAWNLAGLRKGWEEYPEWMDFLAEDSPGRAFKALQTQLYRDVIGDLLDAAEPLRVLDAACGIGRWAVPLAQAGHTVVAIDACEPSLAAARRHVAAAGVGNLVTLIDGDVNTTDLGDGYDVVLAMELLCYLPDPNATAARLAATLVPGGHLVASVEAWPGALLADHTGLALEDVAAIVGTRTIAVPNDRYVRLLAADELAAILRQAGLDVVRSEGLFRVLDGPLMGCVDPDRLPDPAYREALLELERTLGNDPDLAPLPRAHLAVGRRQG
jgi:2-polyprenyl-3-methyl-5-hydroxy-6-metoxy-1,4-benzoquinol methylase